MRFLTHVKARDGYQAYQVRLPVPVEHFEYPYWSQTFAFHLCDGQEGARQRAELWRDEQGEDIWGEQWPLIRDRQSPVGANWTSIANSSGVLGVRRMVQHGNPAWYCQWQIGPIGQRKTKRRSFAVAKYGEEEAKRLAIQARQDGIFEDHMSRSVGGSDERV